MAKPLIITVKESEVENSYIFAPSKSQVVRNDQKKAVVPHIFVVFVYV